MANHPALQVFGTFQAIALDGEDITDKFTPQLSRLFTLLLLHPGGVSSKVIDKLLWSQSRVMSLKNSRNVTMNRLRCLLSLVGGIEVVFDRGMFALSVSDPDRSEFHHEIEVRDELNAPESERRQEALRHWIPIIMKGELLPMRNEPWVESAREKIRAETMRLLHVLLSDDEVISNAHDRLLVADAMQKFDDLNEFAFRTRVSTLYSLRQYSVAAQAYDQYSNAFKRVFGRPYDGRFEEIVSEGWQMVKLNA